MERWVKFVALLVLAFTLYDVSVPENCLVEGLAISTRTRRLKAAHRMKIEAVVVVNLGKVLHICSSYLPAHTTCLLLPKCRARRVPIYF